MRFTQAHTLHTHVYIYIYTATIRHCGHYSIKNHLTPTRFAKGRQITKSMCLSSGIMHRERCSKRGRISSSCMIVITHLVVVAYPEWLPRVAGRVAASVYYYDLMVQIIKNMRCNARIYVVLLLSPSLFARWIIYARPEKHWNLVCCDRELCKM